MRIVRLTALGFVGVTLVALGFGATACSRGEKPAPEASRAAASEASRAPAVPPGGALPPGHPPLGASREPGVGILPVPAPRGPGPAAALTWTTPSGWTSVPPASRMRRAQYRLLGAGGPGECAVFYFGPGQGGDPQANADRWANQFKRPDGTPSRSALRTRQLDVGGISVLRVEVTGTFVGGMGGGPRGPERPDYMLLGAIAAGPDANWFFKCTGPKATLEDQRAAFDGMLQSIKQAQ